jgi:hypothetical protein
LILNHEINYIVSGIERSGTSMLMQILNQGGIPIKFDDSRREDENNPKGYYELEGGKIINKLMDNTFPLDEFKGSFIKITAYGLKYLPPGNYKIIYSERNIEEILDSMEKMADIKDENRLETKETFLKLNSMIKESIEQRIDCDIVYVNYNKILEKPEEEIEKIIKFLDLNNADVDSMIEAIDTKLYRQRHKNIA